MRARLGQLAEFFALTGVAITVPILDVFGRSPETFVRAGASRADLWAFALIVAFVPPTMFALAESVMGFVHRGAANRFHALAATGLIAAAVIPFLRTSLDLRGTMLFVLAVAASSLATIAAVRFDWIRQWVRFASPLPLVSLAMFLFIAPVSDLGNARATRPVEVAADELQFDGPIVMVVLDEFPLSILLDAEGAIDATRYPNFARLAAGSTWYRNTTAVAARTEQAVPALLTGQYPTKGIRPPDWSQYPNNLFRLLGGAFEMRVDEEITDLCPDEYCPDMAAKTPTGAGGSPTGTSDDDDAPTGRLLDLARDLWTDRISLDPSDQVAETQVSERIDPIPTDRSATPTTAASLSPEGLARLMNLQPTRFVDFLDGINASSARRSFNFLHVLLPHVPWHLTASGIPYEYSLERTLQFPGFAGGWSTQTAADAARVRVAMQAGYVDSLVGDLLDQLEATGIWDDAMVVVAADHGLGIHQGSRMRYLGTDPYELLGVPLFMRIPGVEARVNDRPAQLVDVVPTIADALGVDVPWAVDGISLLGEPTTRGSHPFASGAVGSDPTIETIDVSENLDQVLASATRHFRTTDARQERDRMFLDLGERPDLIGVRVDAAPLAPIDAVLEFPNSDRFADVEPTRPLPLHVVAHADDDVAADELVAIALNGTIAGIARTFSDDEHDARFTALLDPTLLREGPNELSFWRVSPNGS